MSQMELSFVEFLGVEEHNLTASLVNFGPQMSFFTNLDFIFQRPFVSCSVPLSQIEKDHKRLIHQLCRFAHNHLYISVSTLFRGHLAECLASIRIAIDATLSAYKVISDPDTAEKYYKRDVMFQKIIRTIKNERTNDGSKYSLAPKILGIHRKCSEYGSHADVSVFAYRLSTQHNRELNESTIQLHYFQFPESRDEFRYYFLFTLWSYFLMFEVFKLFFDQELIIIDQKYEAKFEELRIGLDKERRRYHRRSR